MRVIIITEAGSAIGFGHLARCSALYEAFKEVAADVSIFLSAGSFSQAEKVFPGINILDRCWDEEGMLEGMGKEDIVVVDSYLLGSDFYKKVYERAALLISIDDFCRMDYPGGIVLNGLICAEGETYSKQGGTEYLLGSKYSLLRKSFWTQNRRCISEIVENIFVTFGGSSVSDKFMKDLIDMLLSNHSFRIHAISSDPTFPGDAVTGRLRVSKGLDAEEMRAAMEDCDLCISGGGTTLYELAATGTPTIGICFADNQVRHLREWAKSGFLYDMGWFNKAGVLRRINNCIGEMQYKSARVNFSRLGEKSIDGKGAKRVVEKAIKCREVSNGAKQ